MSASIATIEIVIIVLLALLFLVVGRLKEESISLKNIQLLLGIAAVLVGGHFSYKKLISEKEDKEKLPAVLNIDCKIEKVGEDSSCYWLKASLNYENKSERRINILSSSFYVFGSNIIKIVPKKPIPRIIHDRDSICSRNYTDENMYGEFLYSRKIESQNWHDFNELCKYSYVIPVPKSKDFDIVTLQVYVAIANNKREDFPSSYKFIDSVDNDGLFFLNVDYTDENKTTNISDSIHHPAYLTLTKEYGFCYTASESQLYLKAPVSISR